MLHLTPFAASIAGLPTVGSSGGYVADAGLLEGFELSGTSADGGNVVYCNAHPGDGGMDIRCVPSCAYDSDAGCDPGCSGTLTPQ